MLYWIATLKRYENFEDVARQLWIPLTKKLGLEYATRWNSTYLMLQTTLLYKNVFIKLKQHKSEYNDWPQEEDWLFAQEVCGKLKLFYGEIEIFSSTKYPTANLYFSKICEIKLALNQWLISLDKTISDMAFKMLTKFDTYRSVIHYMIGVATILDPSYKMSLLEFYFPRVYGTGSKDQVEKIRKLFYDVADY